jgi:CDP-diacylglycerol--glycerol-3-phosphate 3-phosphatidyltransferase
MATFQELRKKAQEIIAGPVVPVLNKLGITPNVLTTTGVLINLAAAVVIGFGHVFWGGIVFLLAGLFDLLDGALARHMGKSTRFGAFYDSVSDRFTEGALYLSFIFIATGATWPFSVTWQLVLIFLALIGSFLTSYLRARAEGLGMDCTVGLFTRVERVIILALGLLLNQVFIALAIVVVLSFVTVGQRFVHVWRQTGK